MEPEAPSRLCGRLVTLCNVPPPPLVADPDNEHKRMACCLRVLRLQHWRGPRGVVRAIALSLTMAPDIESTFP